MFKAYILRKEILPVYAPSELLAIESNPATRRMYDTYSVKAVTWNQFLSSAGVIRLAYCGSNRPV